MNISALIVPRLGLEDSHSAYDTKCPAIKSEIEKKKSLNSQRLTMGHS